MNCDAFGTIAAIFVAFCALGVSIWQGYEIRRNYRLSVTPNIYVIGHWTIDSERIGIFLENKGIGPAFITIIEINIDGQNFNLLINPQKYLSALNVKLLEVGIGQFNYHTNEAGEIISAREKRPLFWLDDNVKNDSGKILSFCDVFSKISIRVEYKSIYGQIFSTISYRHASKRDERM